ncbi:MAG: hypothetical protein OSA87_03215 [Woeseiaceae bacterium]|nr:hypothetical protein [Woeseiaceae bacterium]
MARLLACRIVTAVSTKDCAATGKRIGEQLRLAEALIVVYISDHVQLGVLF